MTDMPPEYSVTVLLVDDKRSIALLTEAMLADQPDIKFHACLDERQAVDMACQIGPTVILQDKHMPHIDGFNLLKLYRENPVIRDIPVIMLSGEEKAETKAEAFLAGANDYMVKPPNSIELVARIRYHTKAYLDHLERKHLFQRLQEEEKLLKEANQKLKRMATIDALTQIPNRLHFNERLQHEWKITARNKTAFSIAMIDIDNFKQYNDHYGHQQGDTCLQQVAKTMANMVHRPADMIARYGGEEFVVIFPDTPEDGAKKVAEDIRMAIETLRIPHPHAEAAPYVTISLGVASSLPGGTGDEEMPKRLLKAADTALYLSKKNGRNRVTMAE